MSKHNPPIPSLVYPDEASIFPTEAQLREAGLVPLPTADRTAHSPFGRPFDPEIDYYPNKRMPLGKSLRIILSLCILSWVVIFALGYGLCKAIDRYFG